MQGEEYVVFLLKNYHKIKNEIAFLQDRAEGKIDYYPQMTGLFGMVIASAENRSSRLSAKELIRTAKILEQEIADLEKALALLPRIEQGVLKDIYFYGVTWISITHKWHISEPTICRYRRKALQKIWHYMSRGLSCASEGVIECINNRKTTEKKNLNEAEKPHTLSG